MGYLIFKKPTLFFILLIFHSTAFATAMVELIGVKFTYEPPINTVWKLDKTGKESALYKRTALTNPKKNGEFFVPKLSFMAEKTDPKIKNVTQFADTKSQTMTYSFVHQRLLPDRIVKFYNYKDAKGISQRYIISFFWRTSVGLTVICESPELVYSSVEDDFEQFIASFYWL